jgi:cytidylate kinase
MKQYPTIQECRSYVAAHLHAKDHAVAEATRRTPAITISRQTGARGRTIGKKLQNALRARNPNTPVPWTLFDKNLVKKVLQDYNLSTDLEKFMPDDAVSELNGSVNEILGRHPSLWTLFEKTAETIARLCRMGDCIIVGRGGNKITRGFSNVLHVRLIGSTDLRVHQITKSLDMPLKEAQQFVKDEDNARRKYMKKHYQCDIDDPSHYDLEINTDLLDDETVVNILISAAEGK